MRWAKPPGWRRGTVPAGRAALLSDARRPAFGPSEQDVRCGPASRSGAVVLWSQEFPGTALQVGALRRQLEALLADCEARDDIAVIASELASNAVTHTRSGRTGGSFGAELSWLRPCVRIAVTDDGGPNRPRVHSACAEQEGHRGLMVVRGLAHDMGVSGGRRGRTVWADVPWPGDEPAATAIREPATGDDTRGRRRSPILAHLGRLWRRGAGATFWPVRL